MDPGGITREEIGEIIPEYLTNIVQENQRRGNFFKFYLIKPKLFYFYLKMDSLNL